MPPHPQKKSTTLIHVGLGIFFVYPEAGVAMAVSVSQSTVELFFGGLLTILSANLICATFTGFPQRIGDANCVCEVEFADPNTIKKIFVIVVNHECEGKFGVKTRHRQCGFRFEIGSHEREPLTIQVVR